MMKINISYLIFVAFILELSKAKKQNKDATLPSECGKNNVHRIVGGAQAKPHTWPWQVAVYELPSWSTSEKDYTFICGASIINQRYVLCAGHCFQSYGEVTKNTRVKMLLGAHNLESKEGTWAKVSNIYIHPKFDENSMQYDGALVRLAQPIDFSKANGTIAPVCLPGRVNGKENLTNEVTVVTGWGTLSSMGNLSNVLMQVSVPIINKTKCILNYDKDSITDCNICAGLDKGGKDSCQGDSGGPLCIRRAEKWYEYGITSWGRGCAEPNAPGVYARVQCLYPWIINTLAKEKSRKNNRKPKPKYG